VCVECFVICRSAAAQSENKLDEEKPNIYYEEAAQMVRLNRIMSELPGVLYQSVGERTAFTIVFSVGNTQQYKHSIWGVVVECTWPFVLFSVLYETVLFCSFTRNF